MRRTPGARRALLAVLAAGLGITGAAGADRGAKAEPKCPAAPPMTFAEPRYIDTERAGGEPTIVTHPDGTLLVGTHAGTTHLYGPGATEEGAPPDGGAGAFGEHYDGRTYYFWSADDGATWNFVDRGLPPRGLPGSGFSDPDFAIDASGNVFISEINLANISMSKSTDSGRSYVLRNPLAQTISDRQWSEADLQDVVYMTGNVLGGGTSTRPVGTFGHTLFRSTDGGATFQGMADPGGTGDLRVDRRDGTLYEANYSGGRLGMGVWRKARSGDMKREVFPVSGGVGLGFWPSFDIDADGNLYLAWLEAATSNSTRDLGVWFTTSTNGGRSWATPIRIDPDDNTEIWPWVTVGDRGRVAVAWFQADADLGGDAQAPGPHGWRVAVAQSLNGLGCKASPTPRFTVSTATRKPFHRGTICNEGTICQAQLVDRRLGDYFQIDVDRHGRLWGVFADTQRAGVVGIASFVRQSGGAFFTAPKAPPSPPTSTGLPRTLF